MYTRAKNAVMYLVLRHLTCLTQVFRIQKFKLKLMNDNFTWVDSLHRICVHQFWAGSKRSNTKPTLPNYLASSTLQREK